jgi:hypothetical protein
VGAHEAARAFAAKLAAVGIESRVSQRGDLDVGPVGSRSLLIHCFWDVWAISGVRLGANPANAGNRLLASEGRYEGPDYLVILRDGTDQIADGRTLDRADALTCARLWLAGKELDELVREVSCVDVRRRAMEALASAISPELEWEIGWDPAYELWVYGADRSCLVVPEDGVACNFRLGPAHAARAQSVRDIHDAIAAWLIDRLSLAALAARVPEVVLDRHAELLETDPARWHWLLVRDRLANTTDVPVPLRDLLEALIASPIATRFYSYWSHDRLCFSASSHYPWVGVGVPVVTPIDDHTCDVGGAVRCSQCPATH